MLCYDEDRCRDIARWHGIRWKDGKHFLQKIVPEIEAMRVDDRRIRVKAQRDVLALLSWGCTLRVCVSVKHTPHVWHPFFRTGCYPVVPDRVASAVRRRRGVVLQWSRLLDPSVLKSHVQSFGYQP